MELKLETVEHYPNVAKVLSKKAITKENIEFTSAEQAQNHPLAAMLFQLPFITKVYFSTRFIGIEKTDAIDWKDVQEELLEMISEKMQNIELYDPIPEAKLSYSLYAEITPNPNTLKFVSNQLLVNHPVEVKNQEQANNIPVAQFIFDQFDFISEVFINQNYITLTKNHSDAWNILMLEVRPVLVDYLQNGGKLVLEAYWDSNPIQHQSQGWSEKEIQINQILEEYIRPAVANDGGNIDLIAYESDTKTVKVALRGSCSGCPSSTVTLKHGIENMLKSMMPDDVLTVEAVL